MKSLLLALAIVVGVTLSARAQDVVIYDDALQNAWVDYSWATVNFAGTSSVHSGGKSISVTVPANGYQALYLHHATLGASLYQSISFWIYPTAAGTNQLQVQATLYGAAQTSVKLSFTAGQVNQWQQVTIPLSSLGVANAPGFDGFWIQTQVSAAVTFYVDDITLIAIPPPNPVPVTVDAQSVIRTIDDRMFGMNLNMWDSHVGDAATSTLLVAVDTRVLRLPGGSNSDDYDWHLGRMVSNNTFQWTTHAATFARIVEARSAQAYITVNYGSGTPEQAAAWVAYYNGSATNTAVLDVDSKGRDFKTVGYWAAMRSAAPLGTDDGFNFLRISHPAPFGFRYWEIGNENYGGWENDLHGVNGSGLSGIAHDPWTYAQSFQSFYNKMLTVDPTIRIGAVVNPGEDTYGIGTHAVANPNEGNSLHTGWTPVMLATLKSLGVLPHFLIHHSYAQNPGNENDAVLLQAGVTIELEAADLRKMVTDYVGGAQGSAIELVVTEMNSVTSDSGKQTTSLVNALFFADTIGHLARTEFNACAWWAFRNGGLTYTNMSPSLYGWRNFGDYGVVADGSIAGTPVNTPFPSFYAAKLLTAWGRGGDRTVSATSSYGMLAVHAAKLANGSLAILVINKHPTTDLTAQITLANFTPGSASAPLYAYGKANDLANGDLTAGTASIPGATFTRTFPSYSMTVLVVKGPFEAWREAKFTAGELADWTSSGDAGQPARDGLPNLVKYALGLEPKTPAASGLPHIAKVALSGKTYLTLTYPKNPALTDITSTVEVSGDLQQWQSGPLSTVRTDDGSTNTATYRDLTAIEDAPRRFIRLKIARP